MINLNIQTVLIHLVFFLAMLVILNELLFKPLLRVMDEREKRVEGNRQIALKAGSESDHLKKDYTSQLDAAKKDSVKERDEIRKLAEAEEDKIIKAAREKAGDMIGTLRESIAAEFDQAQATLRADSETLGKEIAKRILGRAV